MTKLNAVSQEVERLLALTEDERKLEEIYADNAQLKFLLKKLSVGKMDTSAVKGMGKFVSDFASSDSKILMLVDSIKNT